MAKNNYLFILFHISKCKKIAILWTLEDGLGKVFALIRFSHRGYHSRGSRFAGLMEPGMGAIMQNGGRKHGF